MPQPDVMEDSQDITTKLRMSQQELSYRQHVITLKSNQDVTSTVQPVCHNHSTISISQLLSSVWMSQPEHMQDCTTRAQSGFNQQDTVTVSQLKYKFPLPVIRGLQLAVQRLHNDQTHLLLLHFNAAFYRLLHQVRLLTISHAISTATGYSFSANCTRRRLRFLL